MQLRQYLLSNLKSNHEIIAELNKIEHQQKEQYHMIIDAANRFKDLIQVSEHINDETSAIAYRKSLKIVEEMANVCNV